MQEIITITQTTINGAEENSANARDLHKALGLKSDFSTWIKKELELFVENVDYIVFQKKMENLSGGRPQVEYIITLDTAKHLSMIQRNEKGKEVRDYFIEVEKKANKPMTQVEMILASAQLIQAQEERLNAIEVKIDTNHNKLMDDVVELIEERQPSEVKASKGFTSLKGFNAVSRVSMDIVRAIVSSKKFVIAVEEERKTITEDGLKVWTAYKVTDLIRAIDLVIDTSDHKKNKTYFSPALGRKFQIRN